jgi:hypothetical protein
MDGGIVLPANEEFKCGDLFYITTVRDNVVDDVLIAV